MKRPTAILLCLALLTATLTASEWEKSPPGSESGYGIDSEKSYPGTEVMDLIAIVEEEAETAIAEAYAEGFKAGKKEEAGNAAYWESVAYRYREQAKKPPWIIPAWAASILITFIGGTATGIAVAR